MQSEPAPDPRGMIYAQLRRALDARSSGSNGAEEVAGLLALIEGLKDEAYAADIGDRARAGDEEGEHERFWCTVESVVKLLVRRRMWVQPGRIIAKGEEFEEGF